ncbi:MAG: protein kinase domain-containing protein [Vicinamibacterales bacterium]
MPLQPGTRLGPYDILASIGKGGMGEVYRARDTRLNRDVAIKVANAEFSERFSREARSIAALNHSNVCHLYDVGPNYLVLEYVEGENLRGPLSLDEALPIVRQLIDGIEAAHEKNIVHRDLKPANIKMTPEGVVKILDFGLAKATEPESSGDPDNSPTFTMGATQPGVILGTAAYMPPEQARGKTADRRCDIWSFGVVVYELLVGRRPFEGETASEILGAVMHKEPDWSRVPPRAERLLRWCLEKDRRKRLAAIGDARLLLEESGAPVLAAVSEGTGRRMLWPAVAAALLLLAAASGYGWWSATRPVARPLTRLSVDLGPEAIRGPRITAVLSPDGTRIVFTGRGASGTRQLFTRRLDQAVAIPLAGTEFGNASATPFFSPDGEWIGFFVGGTLRRVAAQGGAAVAIGEAPLNHLGASWGEDGNIIVGSVGGLMRIHSAGGTAEPLKNDASVQFFPQVLPGARAVLFNTAPLGAFSSLDDLSIAAFVFETGETRTLLAGGYWPRYLATSGRAGHLVYMHEGTLFGVAFDPARLEIRGTPTPLIEDVAASRSILDGGGQFAFSDTGTFAYLSGTVADTTYPMLWLDAAGRTTPLVAQLGTYGAPRLSPDGTRLAYTVLGSKGVDVWVYDVGRDTPTQLTFTGPGLWELAWAPDSKHLVFGDGRGLWWIRADGSGQPLQLLDKAENPRPFSFRPDGRLVYTPFGTAGLPDIWTLPIDLSDPERPKPGKAEPFLVEPHVEVDPAFSPDGNFLAYASTESGPNEVFVRPFPGPGGKWKISTAGGKFPTWSRATRELFFLGGDDRIMVVSYTIEGDSFSAGRPRPWSPTQVLRDGVRQNFDVSADGKRAVIFPRPAAEQTEGSLHVTFLLNFFDEVRRRIP